MEYYSLRKRNEILTRSKTLINFKNTMLKNPLYAKFKKTVAKHIVQVYLHKIS